MYQAVDASAGGAFLAGKGILNLAGASLRGAGVAAVATIREGNVGGRILAVLGAAAGGTDHFQPQRPIQYSGNVWVVVAGAGAEVILYQN